MILDILGYIELSYYVYNSLNAKRQTPLNFNKYSLILCVFLKALTSICFSFVQIRFPSLFRGSKSKASDALDALRQAKQKKKHVETSISTSYVLGYVYI